MMNNGNIPEGTQLNKMLKTRFTISRSIVRSHLLAGIASLTVLASGNVVAQDDFVDSVNDWGLWELGIEPAAGGPVIVPQAPVNVKTNNLQFRPNDNSSFASEVPVVVNNTNPTSPPPSAPGVATAPPGSAPGGGTL